MTTEYSVSHQPERRFSRSKTWRKFLALNLVLFFFAAIGISACSDNDDDEVSTPAVTTTTRDSGMLVTVQSANGITVHTLTAPEAVFANSTHLIETETSLVAIDTQFLLPNATDMRAYATEIGKPIDRVFITHDHPDHFLGSEAFNDLPIFALQETSDLIGANGDAEVAEKQGDFGVANIASTYVVPQIVQPGSLEIDGITYELENVLDAEAANQLVIRIPNHGVVITGDIVYSGVHLILAGQIDPWISALQTLAASGDQYPIVLAGHGVPADPSVYDANIQWLTTAKQLLANVDNSADYRQGLIDAFPNLGMVPAIDFAIPFLFPDEQQSTDDVAVDDSVLAEQRANLDAATRGMGFGPQSPRDLNSVGGANTQLFPTAPAYTEMNLCNLHFHEGTEHKGGEFTKYIGNGDGEGNGTGYEYSGELSESELAGIDSIIGMGENGDLRPGDTIEVHYVFTTAQVEPGPTLNSCFNDATQNPELRVETQVYVLVNDEGALDFVQLNEVQLLNGLYQAPNIPNNTGDPVNYNGSTTGPGFNEAGSPFQVSWSVRPNVAKVNVLSVGTWLSDNIFDEEDAHGVRNLVVNPDLLSQI